MDLEQYTVSFFVMDESFRNWVLTGEDTYWENWLQNHPEKAAEVEEAKHLIQTMHFREDELSTEQYTELSSRILQAVKEYEQGKPARKMPLWQRKWNTYYVAASIAGILVLSTLLYFWLQNWNKVVYATSYGETRQVTLADGSTVILNANSSIRYSKDWENEHEREVWLEGEAFFVVHKKQKQDQSLKFIVHTDDVQIEVLGTQFTVSKRETNTRVVLNEGKIRLDILNQPSQNNIVMQPGDWVEYEALQQKITRKTVNAQVYSSWTHNKWILENTSLKQVATQIEETFGVEVVVPDIRLSNESMTGVIPIETLDKALDVVAATYNVKIEHKDDRLVITRNLPR